MPGDSCVTSQDRHGRHGDHGAALHVRLRDVPVTAVTAQDFVPCWHTILIMSITAAVTAAPAQVTAGASGPAGAGRCPLTSHHPI